MPVKKTNKQKSYTQKQEMCNRMLAFGPWYSTISVSRKLVSPSRRDMAIAVAAATALNNNRCHHHRHLHAKIQRCASLLLRLRLLHKRARTFIRGNSAPPACSWFSWLKGPTSRAMHAVVR